MRFNCITLRTIRTPILCVAVSLLWLSYFLHPTLGRLSNPQPHIRQLASSNNSYHNDSLVYEVPLLGVIQTDGYYFIDIYVGWPNPQRQSVILDTGSSLLGFTCTNCSQCGVHNDKPFNPRLSTTSRWLGCNGVCECSSQNVCTYSVEYEEGSSLHGHMFTDVTVLGGKWENGTVGTKWISLNKKDKNIDISNMTDTDSVRKTNRRLTAAEGNQQTNKWLDHGDRYEPTDYRRLNENLSDGLLTRSLSSPEIRAVMVS